MAFVMALSCFGFIGGCTWERTQSQLGQAAAELGIRAKFEMHNASRWMLPTTTQIRVASVADDALMAPVLRGLRRHYPNTRALFELDPAVAIVATEFVDLDLAAVDGDLLLFIDYARTQPIRFWVLGKRWRLPRPGRDSERALVYLIDLGQMRTIDVVELRTRSAAGRRLLPAHIEEAFRRYAGRLAG